MLQKPLPAEAVHASGLPGKGWRSSAISPAASFHDFNNILTVISGTIDLLAEAVADRPDLAAIAGLIAEAAARGASLTSHLLAFARGQPSQPRDVDVAALLVDAARLLQPTLGEQIEISTAGWPAISSAWVDPSQLMTAILNLAIVARDAMPDGGKLMLESREATVAGEGRAGAEPEFSAAGISAADHVTIAVSVSGYGGSAGCRRRPSPTSRSQAISPGAPTAISGCVVQPAGRRPSKFTCRGQPTSSGRMRRLRAWRISRAAIRPS